MLLAGHYLEGLKGHPVLAQTIGIITANQIKI